KTHCCGLPAEFQSSLGQRAESLAGFNLTKRRTNMNGRMKRVLLTALLIAPCAFSASSLIQPEVQAQDDQPQINAPRGQGCCDLLSARGQGIATAPDTFVVDAVFNISGGQFGGVFGAKSLLIKSTTKLLAQSPPMANGTVNVITSHVFEVKGQ